MCIIIYFLPISSHKMCDSKEAEFEPPGLAEIFFSDIQSITLNYHTPSLNHFHILLLTLSTSSLNSVKGRVRKIKMEI